MAYRHGGRRRRIFARGDSFLHAQPRPCTGRKRELDCLLMTWKDFVGALSEGDQEDDRCIFLVRNLDVDTREMAYFFDRVSSNTSKTCSTRLFAVRSSLPTVTRTGSRWNEAASFRTESGHVALTRIFCEWLIVRTNARRSTRTH